MATMQKTQIIEWRSPSKGLITSVSAKDLPQDGLALCRNFDLDSISGALVRRGGFVTDSDNPIEGNTPVAVFEMPVANLASSPPSTPRILIDAELIPVDDDRNPSPTYPLLYLKAFMKPYWNPGGSVPEEQWINDWLPLGTAGEKLLGSDTTEFNVRIQPILQGGEVRFYVSTAQTADGDDSQTIMSPQFIGYLSSEEDRFKDGDGLNGQAGPDFFVEDLRSLPPRQADVGLSPTFTNLDAVGVTGVDPGTRNYRMCYVYDGYQFGGLSDAHAVSVPFGQSNNQGFVNLELKVKNTGTFPYRPQKILIFALRAQTEADEDVGSMALIHSVSVEDGPNTELWSTILDSNVEDIKTMVSGNIYSDFSLIGSSVTATRERDDVPRGVDFSDPFHANYRYLLTGETQGHGYVRSVVATPMNDDENSRYLDLGVVTDEISIFGSGNDLPAGSVAVDAGISFAKNDADTLRFDSADVVHLKGISLVDYNEAEEFSHFKFFVGLPPEGMYLPPIEDWPPAARKLWQSIEAGPPEGRYGIVMRKSRHGETHIWFHIESTVTREDAYSVEDGIYYLAVSSPMPFSLLEDLNDGDGYFDGAEEGLSADDDAILLLVDKPVAVPHLPDQAIDGVSHVTPRGPLFADWAGSSIEANDPPSTELTINYDSFTFTEPWSNIVCNDGRTLWFKRTAAQYDDVDVADVTSGTLEGVTTDGWKLSDTAATVSVVDPYSDAELLGMETYAELAQSGSLVTWASGSTAARVGNRIFVGDVRIPDPDDRFKYLKETANRHRILYSSFTGQGQAAPDFMNPINMIQVGEGTSRIIALGEQYGRLIVWTKEACYQVHVGAGNAAAYSEERQFSGAGCVSANTVVSTPKGLMWLAPGGVHIMSGSAVQNISEALNTNAFLDKIKEKGHTAHAAYDPRRQAYVLYIDRMTGESEDSPKLSTMYVFDNEGRWTTYTVPFELTWLTRIVDGGVLGIYDKYRYFDVTGRPQIASAYGLLRSDTTAEYDLEELCVPVEVATVTAKAKYANVQPGGGDRMVRLTGANIDMDNPLAKSGTVTLGVDSRETEGDAVAEFAIAGDDAVLHGRFPISERVRSVQVGVSTSVPGMSIDRTSLEFIPKGRVRSLFPSSDIAPE
jgi:hypothetical protein